MACVIYHKFICSNTWNGIAFSITNFYVFILGITIYVLIPGITPYVLIPGITLSVLITGITLSVLITAITQEYSNYYKYKYGREAKFVRSATAAGGSETHLNV